MRMRDIYSHGEFRLSIEIFPPKTEAGDAALFENLQRLVDYRPAFVSCTYGAGGSTRTRTIDLCAEIQMRFALPATAHLTCVGATREELHQWLNEARQRGVKNIMALRGDAPAGAETFPHVEGGLRHANELVELIRGELPDQGIGVAGYPEIHPEAPNADEDLVNLRRKVDAGADAVFTQLFFANKHFFEFRRRYEQAGITVPLIPGIMPITNFERIKRITKMCGAAFPETLATKLEAAQDDEQAQFDIGVEYAVGQCRELMDNGVPGIHFYALNKSKACEAILNALDYQTAT
ncbi:5,10-methylenetetrahydrofolate reductase [Symmachiella dynata]|uniref:Methylenetetrahydrofolate reductase n=1 Tax=Symmachiella dynata TaxID=2527995 RepID=A0A517ZGG8_9PLAN|nr:methylenetetrahydrofolate reductase [NAD(P)H] [Symmachiella dynata]QDU41577.1 5,10-methylenetetrahydrofolate reductase [Symmachiella dynata]